MKVCYKCGHHTEKFVMIPVVIKRLMEDQEDGGCYFWGWKLEQRPYCFFCTKVRREEDIDNVELEEEQ